MQYENHLVEQFANFLKLRNYSNRTIACYIWCLKQFFTKTKSKSNFIDSQIVQNFILWLHDNNFSPKTINLYYNSIKSYMQNILWQKLNFQIKKCKYPRKLPNILSQKEIEKIISKTINTKHKLILSLAYGSGLRVSEVVNLFVKDLDFDRGILSIKCAKWQKDRISILPHKIMQDLKNIIKNKKSWNYIFENVLWDKLTTRTCQKIFHQACDRVWILKSVSFHSLRHSFATHLLESGLDVTYVQKLLWHSNIKTTQNYLHIVNSSLKNIQSPLDKF